MTLDHLLLAEMNVLQGRYAEALALYDTYLPSAEGDGFLHEVTAAMSDRGHCCLAMGRTDEGLAQLQTALQRVDESTPHDIRAIAHGNLAAALNRLGRSAEAEQHRLMAGMAWDTYAHEQREARRLLAGEPVETAALRGRRDDVGSGHRPGDTCAADDGEQDLLRRVDRIRRARPIRRRASSTSRCPARCRC